MNPAIIEQIPTTTLTIFRPERRNDLVARYQIAAEYYAQQALRRYDIHDRYVVHDLVNECWEALFEHLQNSPTPFPLRMHGSFRNYLQAIICHQASKIATQSRRWGMIYRLYHAWRCAQRVELNTAPGDAHWRQALFGAALQTLAPNDAFLMRLVMENEAACNAELLVLTGWENIKAGTFRKRLHAARQRFCRALLQELVHQCGPGREEVEHELRALGLAEYIAPEIRDAFFAGLDSARKGEPMTTTNSPGVSGFHEESWPTIPGYQIKKVLGQGGSGVVYLATQLNLQRDVALKIITGEQLRFRRERDAQKQFQHPHIVSVHDGSHHGPVQYLALELCLGGTLQDHFRNKPAAPKLAAAIVKVLAETLAYIHEFKADQSTKGLIHRDLKPSNILLTKQPNAEPFDTRALKVADFGLVRSEDATAYTVTDGVVGTPVYMSPEQTRPYFQSRLDQRTDIYALGGILHFLLTGTHPYEGNPVTVIDQVRKANHAPPMAEAYRVPPDLDAIYQQAMSPWLTMRYKTARALAADLGRFINDKPVTARPLSWFGVLRAALCHYWQRVLGCLLLVVMVLSLAGWAAWKPHKAEGPQETVPLPVQPESLRGPSEADRLRHQLEALKLYEQAVASAKQRDFLTILPTLATATDHAHAAGDSDFGLAIQRLQAAWQPYAWVRRATWSLPQAVPLASQFDPSGKSVLLRATATVSVWDWANQQRRWDKNTSTTAATFDARGNIVAIDRQRKAYCWRAADGQTLWERQLQGQGTFTHVAIDPEQRWLLAADDQRRAMVIDVLTGATRETVPHEYAILALSVDRINSTPRTATAFHFTSPNHQGKQLIAPRFGLSNGPMEATAYSHDGQLLLTLNQQRLLRLQVVNSERPPVQTVLADTEKVTTLALSNEGRYCLRSGPTGTVSIWELPPAAALKPVRKMNQAKLVVADPMGSRLAVVLQAPGQTEVWDVQILDHRGERVGQPLSHRAAGLPTMAFTPNAEQLFVGTQHGDVYVWETATQQLVTQFKVSGLVTHIAVANDVCLVSTTNETSRWRLAQRQVMPLGKPLRHPETLQFARTSHDGSLLLTMHEGLVRLWVVDTWQGRATHKHKGTVTAVAFSPDDSRIAIASTGNNSLLLNAQTGQVLHENFTRADVDIPALAFNHNASTLLTCSGPTVQRWTATGTALGSALPHHARVTALAIAPRSSFLLVGEQGGVAWLWDLQTGAQLGPAIPCPFKLSHVGFLRDGHSYTVTAEGAIEFWRWPEPISKLLAP